MRRWCEAGQLNRCRLCLVRVAIHYEKSHITASRIHRSQHIEIRDTRNFRRKGLTEMYVVLRDSRFSLSCGSGWLFTVEPGAGHRSDEDFHQSHRKADGHNMSGH